MTKLTLLLLSGLFLASCQSTTLANKEKELLQKENELLQKENELLKKNQSVQTTPTSNSAETPPERPITTSKHPQVSVQHSTDWLGSWSFEEDMVGHKLVIEDKYRGMNICTYEASGIQTFYNLECRGVDNGDSFELYYWATNDGAFYQEERINREKPILTLKLVNGKVLTYWNQLIGGQSGKVCFRKD